MLKAYYAFNVSLCKDIKITYNFAVCLKRMQCCNSGSLLCYNSFFPLGKDKKHKDKTQVSISAEDTYVLQDMITFYALFLIS